MKHKPIIFFLIAFAQIVLTVCSDRVDIPIQDGNSTIVYPSKSSNGIESSIIFCERISKRTNKPVKEGNIFAIKEEAKVYAVVNLINKNFYTDKELMFHIDWLDSTGNSFYKKRIDFSPNDSTSNIISSISISPQKRKVGNYIFRVYLFRELIAEKNFKLVESLPDSVTDKKQEVTKKKTKSEKKVEVNKSKKTKVKTENLEAKIILCRKLSKKTGKPIGVDTIFTIRDKEKVKAIVNFEKPGIKTNEQLKFYFNWIDSEGKIFYKKRIVYTTSNPSFSISNSISITPEKRKPGNYTVQVVFKKKILAEQKFELIVQNK